MVGHKWHIADDHGVFCAADHRLAVVNHVIHGHGDRTVIAEDNITQAVADQDDGNAATINDFSGGIIVSSEHGDFLAVLFHLADVINGNAFD